MTKKFVPPSIFRKERVGKDIHYFHRDGEYVIRKLRFPGYKRKKWGVEYIGPARGPSHNPILGYAANTLREMMARVDEHYSEIPGDAKSRAIFHLVKGEHLAAIDIIFEYIDFRFANLEREIDGRFENLRISSDSDGHGY